MSKGRVAWVNGEFVPEADAKVSVYDSALMFGDMVFEMTRSFGGEQFMLREHLERLYAGIRILRIPVAMSLQQLTEVIGETIERNKPAFGDDDEHRIMVDVSRGPLSIYRGVAGLRSEPTVIITDFPLRWTVRGMGELYDAGIHAAIPAQRAIPSHLLDPKIKNRSRLHYLMANMEVAAYGDGDAWALLLDPDGFIAEGTGDNFFIVVDGKILTPEGRNILRGVSRNYVMSHLAVELGIEVGECNLEPYDVYTADEAFMTGTPFCMLPVTRLNGIEIGDGKVGPVFEKLLRRWSQNVGVDIKEQIKRWDEEAGSGGSAGNVTPYRFRDPGKKS